MFDRARNTESQRQKLYVDQEEKILGLALEHPTGCVSVFVQHWAADEVLLVENAEVNHIVEAPSTCERYLREDGKIREQIFDELDAVQDRYVCRIGLEKDVEIIRLSIELQ